MLRRVFLKSLAGTTLMLPGLAAFGEGPSAGQTKGKPGQAKAIKIKNVHLTEAQFKKMTALATSKNRMVRGPKDIDGLLKQVGYEPKRGNEFDAAPGLAKVMENAKSLNPRDGERHFWWGWLWCLGIHGCWFICCPQHFNCNQYIVWMKSPRDVGKITLQKTQYGFYGIK